MTLSTAEIHVRACVRDILPEAEAEKLLADEAWLDAEISKVLAAVTDAQGADAHDLAGQERGLAAYNEELRARIGAGAR